MRPLYKRIVLGVGLVVLLLVVTVGGLYAVGSARWNRAYEVETADISIPSDPAEVARGEHLLRTNGCMDCHGEDLSGRVFVDGPPFRVTAANLTSGRGGLGAVYSDEDFDRAIRHGVKADGTPVMIMPSAAYHNLSDADAAALIAYLRTVPPVDNELPPTEIRPLGRLLSSFAIDATMEVRTLRPPLDTAPPRGSTLVYGEYLANVTCAYCHGGDLNGAEPKAPGSPTPTDIVASASSWSLEQWKETLRTGVRPDGRTMDPEFMPWTFTANMTEEELEALYAYVSSLGE